MYSLGWILAILLIKLLLSMHFTYGKSLDPKINLSCDICRASSPNSNSHANLSSQNLGIDTSLNLGSSSQLAHKPSYMEILKGEKSHLLTGANLQPLGPCHGPRISTNARNHKSPFVLGRTKYCSHCFSSNHTRWACTGPIKCGDCFRFGHISASCHFNPRFLGLSAQPSFANQISINAWTNPVVQT